MTSHRASGAVRPTAARTTAARPALAGLSLSMLLSALGTSIAPAALPTLADAFSAPFRSVQWVLLAHLLAVTALVVGAGRLGDLFGRRRLLLTGLSLYTVASVVCAAAPTLWLLIGARAAQGVGAAFMMALTMAFVGEAVPKERTGRAMGLLGTMSAVGTALGPSMGGALIAGFGWRAVFAAPVPLGVAALLLVGRHLPADRQAAGADRARFDGSGTLLLALTLAAYALAMTLGHGGFGPLDAALLTTAALGAGLFVRAQARAASPLVPRAVLRTPGLRAGLATSALVSTVMMTTLVVGPFQLSRALGLDAAPTGLLLSVGPLVAAVNGVPAGARRTDRRLRGVPDGEQHGRHGGRAPGPARSRLRHAGPGAQPGSRHRGLRHGRGVRAGGGHERRRDGVPRGGGRRDPDDLRGGRGPGPPRTRRRGARPCRVRPVGRSRHGPRDSSYVASGPGRGRQSRAAGDGREATRVVKATPAAYSEGRHWPL